MINSNAITYSFSTNDEYYDFVVRYINQILYLTKHNKSRIFKTMRFKDKLKKLEKMLDVAAQVRQEECLDPDIDRPIIITL